MDRITEQNYYKLLEISPKASFEEVRVAYDQAINIYSSDSISTYSLFTEKERKQILSRLTEACKTLTNGRLRKEYDHLLMERGELTDQEVGLYSADDSCVPKGKLADVDVESLTPKETSINPEGQTAGINLDLFEGQTSVFGKDIKAVRLAKEIGLEEIHQKTNIPQKTLEDIEEDRFERLPALVYLKGFLKSFAKILNVNQNTMVNGYIERYLAWKNTCQK
jgi:curved DNA-binding protein CbpA